ncbi:unnamed protein product [Cunninghamella blakesleeana]
MLTRFLYRLLEHPILSKEHILHQFLQPELIWSDLVSRPPLSNLKNPFAELPTANVSNDYAHSFVSSIPGSSSIAQAIPIPSVSYSLKDPDPKYTKSETYIDNHVQHTFIRFDRSQKKVLRRLGDLSNDYSEIGAAYNALSLEEVGVMANIIERLGISNDQTCTEMRKLVSQLEIDFSEHVQEYVQYISIAKQSNRYWYMKQVQLEMIGEALITKQTTLQTLLKTEGDAERLQATMTSSTLSASTNSTIANQNINNNNNTNIDHNDHNDKSNNSNNNNNNNDTNSIDFDTHSIEDGFATIDTFSIPSHENGHGDNETLVDSELQEYHYPSGASVSAIRASKSRSKKWSSPRKLLNAMTYTIQEMIDVDPALTRRNQIGKLKETIWQLELAKQKTQEEAKKIGETIQEEFERLEKLKSTELKRMIIQFAKLQLQFCEKSMVSWKETRKEVDNMSIIND